MTTRTALALRNRDTRDFEALVEIVHGDGRREVVTCGYRDTEGEALELASENIATMARRAHNVAAAEALLTIADAYDAAATFAEELDDDAVYCELCGGPAVLVGEQLTCPECAPIGDDVAALVPDPATWVAVSEAPCAPVACNVCGGDGSPCVECNPVEHPYLMTGSPCAPEHRCDLSQDVTRRALFDALCQAVDELRDYWRDVPKRVEAINVAWEWVMLQSVYHFNAQGDLLVPSGSTPGKVYAVGHTCPCQAGRWGNHCRHSVIADIIGRARLIARMQKAA